MSFTPEDHTSVSNILIPSMDSLQIRPKSPDSSICSNEDSYCSLDVVEPSLLPYHDTSDELPIFSIRSLSPTSRSLSPVVADQMCISPFDFGDSDEEHCDERMMLNDIQALIGTPDEKNEGKLNLETIFEDVFLETPPKKRERKRFSFDSISRYVKDQQQYGYCNGNYDYVNGDIDCLKIGQYKQDTL